MGCGHALWEKYNITMFELNDYVGGHTHTVTVEEEGTTVPIDTGFMVYNEVTYPNLTRLFRDLNVPTVETTMSFSVQHLPSHLEFCGSSFSGLFAQRKNLLSPEFYRFLRNISRFNKEAPQILDDPRYADYSLDQYVREKGYGANFLHRYLVPMSSAVWSTPPDKMLQFPATTLVRFFKNHGFLGLNTQHQWRTVVGGSKTYRDLLIAPFRDRIRVGTPAVRVWRQGDRVIVQPSKGLATAYDKVIFACHADEALKLLADPTAQERALLSKFKYQRNRVTLHTDAAVMPKTHRAWSSWNYRVDESGTPSIIYWMNSLQRVSKKKDYFVSVNDAGAVRDELILKDFVATHPLFDRAAIGAQDELPTLNDNTRTYFCGSYFRYGFHEDAFTSSLDVCRKLRMLSTVPSKKDTAA
jgi:predicted NAD/FAD-binding protein